jgi:hypothetical protein
MRTILLLVIVMADFIFQPMDFAGARAAIQQKSILPTTLDSAQIAASWSAETKASSFFSATNASEDILSELQTETQALMNLLTPIDGIVDGNDLASAVLRLQNFIANSGWQRPDDVEPGSLADLSSYRRIALVLNTQVQQASAVGNYRQQQEPEQKALYPYLRYIADPRPTRRPDHWRLNGLILPKDHPFWRGHTGPWDYNCFCTVEELSALEAENEGVGEAVVQGDRAVVSFNGGSFEVLAPESGYDFDPADGMATEAA